MTAMVTSERVKYLNNVETREGSYILYWMVNAQRREYNHALEYAIHMSNVSGKTLLVFFGAKVDYQYKRHNDFMLEGLRDVAVGLRNRGIRFIVGDCSGEAGIKILGKTATIVITDKAYIKEETAARDRVMKGLKCHLVEVESNLLIPVEVVSNKEEYAAATIRKKIWKQITGTSFDFFEEKVENPIFDLDVDAIDGIDGIDGIDEIDTIDLSDEKLIKDKEVELVGGAIEARHKLDDFIENKLMNYHLRSNPSEDWSSGLSPYLHFGQISPLEIYLRVLEVGTGSGNGGIDISGFLEELIVRRELAFNFIHYNRAYDSYECLPAWARASLEKHKEDIREYLYSLEELENGSTYDEYWNSAQRELLRSGVMHNYMRMYWGKKILEWSATPEEAFSRAIYLNNKYALDGFDPNSYTGIAWCFGKHDRPWRERDIFGMVRYMNDKGLERKFKMDGYLKRWDENR